MKKCHKRSLLCALIALSFSTITHASPSPENAGVGAKPVEKDSSAGVAVPANCIGTSDLQLACQAIVAGHDDEARRYLDRALARGGAPWQVTAMRAELDVRLQQYPEAVRDFTSALALYPGNAYLLSGRGSAFFRMKDYAHALADFSAALSINPELEDALRFRALTLNQLQENAKAAADFAKLANLKVATDPHDAVDLYWLATVLYDKAHLDQEAMSSVNAALAVAPESARLYKTRGRLERDHGNLVASLHDYSRAEELDPDSSDIRQGRSVTLEWMGQYEAALDELDRILLTDRQDPDAYVDRANVLMEVGRDEQAQADLEVAAHLKPDYPRLLDSRMQLRFYQGDYAGAQRDADLWLSTKGKIDTDTNVQYILLWRHIVMQRQGIDDRDYMVAAVSRMAGPGLRDWPYPIMQYATGRLDGQQLERAVMNVDPQKQNQRVCEADAYVGENYLSHNRPAQAAVYFRRAVDVCPSDYVERTLATRELQRIKRGKGQGT